MADNLCLDSSVIVDQSSNPWGYPPENAIDGNTGTFMHTDGYPNEWWKINLGAVYAIEWIKIIKRAGYGARPENYHIQISDMWDFEDSGATVRTIITASGETAELAEYGPEDYEDSSTGTIKTQYLRIICHTTNQYMSLAEVEIYADSDLDGGNARLSHVAMEALRDGSHNIRLSHVAMEALRGGVPKVRLSHVAIEVLRGTEAPITAQRNSMFLVFPNSILG